MLLGSPSSRLSRPPPCRRARRAGPCTRYAAISAAASDPRRARAGGNEQSLFLATDADTARWSRSVQYSFVPPRGRTAPPRLNHRRVVIIADRAGDRRKRFIPSHVPDAVSSISVCSAYARSRPVADADDDEVEERGRTLPPPADWLAARRNPRLFGRSMKPGRRRRNGATTASVPRTVAAGPGERRPPSVLAAINTTTDLQRHANRQNVPQL